MMMFWHHPLKLKSNKNEFSCIFLIQTQKSHQRKPLISFNSKADLQVDPGLWKSLLPLHELVIHVWFSSPWIKPGCYLWSFGNKIYVVKAHLLVGRMWQCDIISTSLSLSVIQHLVQGGQDSMGWVINVLTASTIYSMRSEYFQLNKTLDVTKV